MAPSTPTGSHPLRYVSAALITALVVLASVWAYNKFSGRNIAQLGAGVAAK